MVTLKRDNSDVVQTFGGKKKRNRILKKVRNVLLTSRPLTIFASVTSTRTLGLRKKEREEKVHLWHICFGAFQTYSGKCCPLTRLLQWGNVFILALWEPSNEWIKQKKTVKKITGLMVIAPLNLHFGSILVLSLLQLPEEPGPVLYYRTSGFKRL